MAIQALLDNLTHNKLQKMQHRNLLSLLNSNQPIEQSTMSDTMSQGLQGHSLSQSPSLNLGDLLGGGQQSAVNQSVGKTPLNIPNFFGAQPQAPAIEKPKIEEPKALKKLKEVSIKESAADRKERLMREKEERAAKSKKQFQIDKETFPYYKKVKEQAATSSEVDARLDEMDELLNTGKVQGPTILAFLDSLKNLPWFIGKFGNVVEKALLNEESQIFNKLSQDFLRDAKPYFGSNLSTREVELFLERVPNLMQSEGGRRGVIRNFRALNEYNKAVNKALDDIIDENGGERPRHIESKVAAKVKPAGENLRKAFRDSVKLIRKPSSNFLKQSYEKNKKKLA